MEVLHYEFKADLNKYLKSLDGTAHVHSMEDVIKFNEENSHKVMPYFGQEHMITAQENEIPAREKISRCPGKESAPHAKRGN